MKITLKKTLKAFVPYGLLQIYRKINSPAVNAVNEWKFLLKQCAEIMAGVEFKGQELQDMYAYLYFKGKKDGFFIDIGAYDGIAISNTYALENIGWKGICVEAVPEVYQRLISNRKCDCVNAALYSEDNISLDFIQTKGGRSGFTKDMSESMIKAAETEGILQRMPVKTMTFKSLMQEYNIEYVDFMSIDVEGAELTILESIDFNKYKFGLITVENNQKGNGGIQLKDFMSARGYKILFDVGVDLIFIPKNIDIGMWWIDP